MYDYIGQINGRPTQTLNEKSQKWKNYESCQQENAREIELKLIIVVPFNHIVYFI